MSGCHPIDICNCKCHYSFDTCSDCCSEENTSPMVKQIQDLEKKLKKMEQIYLNESETMRDMIFYEAKRDIRINDSEERIKQISEWMTDKQELFVYFHSSLDEITGEIGSLKSKKAEAELVADHYIKVINRLDKLEEDSENHPTHENLMMVEEITNELDRKVSNLESENKMRQDTIACVDRAYDTACEELHKRLDKLEERDKLHQKNVERIESGLIQFMEHNHHLTQSHKCQIDENRKISARVDELEKTVSELADKIAEIANFYYKEKKTPQRCPVCNGEGRVTLNEPLKKDNTTYFSISCVPCEGKGIVWSG